MRLRPFLTMCFVLSTLTCPAFAGKKVEFNATVREDIVCKIGYRIVPINKEGTRDEYCAMGPKAAEYYLQQNIDKQINIMGRLEPIGESQIFVIWIDKVGGTKVRDHDPCHISTTYAILAGLNGQTPQLPPGCTGGGSSPSAGTNDSGGTVQEASAPSQSSNPYPVGQSSSEASSSQQPKSAQGSSFHFLSGLPQCTRTQYEPGDLWIVNSCNVAVTVAFTSDSGNIWGLKPDIAPGARSNIASMGFYNPQKDGRVYLFTCPKGASPVMPDGDPFSSLRLYKGQFTCKQ
jgi:hypothetical protein